MKKKITGSEKSIRAMIRIIVLSTFLGAVFLSVIMMLISVGFVKSGNLPDNILPFIIHTAAIISAFFSGFIGGRGAKAQGLFTGLICGAVLVLIILIIRFSYGSLELGGKNLLHYFTLVLAGGIGGILGVNRKDSSDKKIKMIKRRR